MSSKFEKLLSLYLKEDADKQDVSKFYEMILTGSYDDIVKNKIENDFIAEDNLEINLMGKNVFNYSNNKSFFFLKSSNLKMKLFLNRSKIILFKSFLLKFPIYRVQKIESKF